jgi:hypothetical protein
MVSIPLRGAFTIAGTKTLELQHWIAASGSGGKSNLAGTPISSGENEIYLDLAFWKLA